MNLWLFGEAEWNTQETFKQNTDRLFDVSESCGYMIRSTKNKMELEGTDLDVIVAKLHTGSKCNLLIIEHGITTQDGSKLNGKLKTMYVGSCDELGNNFKVLEAAN